MAFCIKILIGLYLIVHVWSIEQNNGTDVSVGSNEEEPSTTPATEEKVLVNEVPQVLNGLPNEAVEALIDRSSHFHHLAHVNEHQHNHHGPGYHGFWKKKFVWRPRWVKTWKEKKVYVAVWKRMWGPAMINEWIPVPKPPPGWFKPGGGNLAIKLHPHIS